jgi:hypothetical protein
MELAVMVVVGIACLPLLRNPKQNKGSLRSVRAEREERERERVIERRKEIR